MLLGINGLTRRLAIVGIKEQTPELSATMLSWSYEQQVFVQMKDAKHSVYIDLTHMSTLPYPADLQADDSEKALIDLQLFIVKRAME